MRAIVVIATLVAPLTLRAQTSYPMLMSVAPVAVQAGSATDCEISARYSLEGTYKVFVTGTGVTGEVLPPEADPKKPGPKAAPKRRQTSKLNVRFTATADALPGAREVRLATPHGVSTVGQIVIVRDPIIRETANNDTLSTAQEVKLPATLCGAFEKAEDVDYYKFRV